MSLTDFFSLEGFAHRSLWIDEAFPWSALLSLSDYLKTWRHRIEIKIPSFVHLENEEEISIGEGTLLEPGVYIKGPCIIGKNCALRHGSYLRGGVILGDGCTIGHGCEVKQSILFDGSSAAHLCYIGDSILGRKVNLGAGVKCANLRLDRKEVAVTYLEERINTGLKKLGAILGDGAQVGCNAVLNPGVLVGRQSLIHPLLNFSGTLPPHSEAKGLQNWVTQPMAERLLGQLLQNGTRNL